MAHYNDSFPSLITVAVIMGLASIVAVLLRIVARKKSRIHLGLDDAFAIAALCGFVTFLGFILLRESLLNIY